MCLLRPLLMLVAQLWMAQLACADIWQAGGPAPVSVSASASVAPDHAVPAGAVVSLPEALAKAQGPSLPTLPPPLSGAMPAPSWWAELQTAARESNVDVYLLQAIVAAESGFKASAVSRFGAVGLMQIMPDTARRVAGLLGNNKSLRQQLLNPQTNLRVGAKLLRHLSDLYGERIDLVLAAYNAGVGNVQKAGQRVPPNRETPRFVQKVADHYASLRAAAMATELGAESERSGILDAPQPASVSDRP